MNKKKSGILLFLACYLVMFSLPVAYAGDDQKCEVYVISDSGSYQRGS